MNISVENGWLKVVQKAQTTQSQTRHRGVLTDFSTFSYFLINKALLYHFLANRLAHNKRMTEKSVFREGWSPEMTSQSFPVSCFLVSRFCTPPEVKFDAFVTSKLGEGKLLSKNFFCHTYQYIREI